MNDAGESPQREYRPPNGGMRQSVEALRRRWRLTSAVFVLLAVLGGIYVAAAPSTYEANAVVAFQPRKGDVTGRDLAALLAQRYPELVASTESINKASAATGVPASQLDAGLYAAIQPNTLNLIIKVALPDPGQALTAANVLYAEVLQAAKTDPNLEAVPVSSPAASDNPVGVSKRLLVMATLLLAAAVAILFTMVWDRIMAS